MCFKYDSFVFLYKSDNEIKLLSFGEPECNLEVQKKGLIISILMYRL